MNKQEIKDISVISNTMNDYYCKVGIDLSNQIKNLDGDQLKLPARNSKSIFINPTSFIDVNDRYSRRVE